MAYSEIVLLAANSDEVSIMPLIRSNLDPSSASVWDGNTT